jgi:hypothetical protein
MDQQQQQVAGGEASSYRSRRDQALAELQAGDLREFEAFLRASSAGTARDLRRHQAADPEDQRPRRQAPDRPASRGGGARAGSTATAAATEGQHQQPGQAPGSLGEQQGAGHGGVAALAPLDFELRLRL